MSSVATAASAVSKGLCVVVGLGGGGIGDAVAHKFAGSGMRCAIVARSDLTSFAKELPHDARSYRCDVTDPAQIQSTVNQIVADHGPDAKVDALVYNVGKGYFKPFEETSLEEFDFCYKAGPAGLFAFVKSLLPHMSATGASIGVTGATASWRGMPATPAFAPSKFATRALCQALARDLGPRRGIHVYHVVIDGMVDKPGLAQYAPDKPKSEILDPEAIAETYFHLHSQPPQCWTHEINVAPSGAFGSIVSI